MRQVQQQQARQAGRPFGKPRQHATASSARTRVLYVPLPTRATERGEWAGAQRLGSRRRRAIAGGGGGDLAGAAIAESALMH